MRIMIIIRITIKGSFSERAGGRKRKPKLTLAFKFSVFEGGRRQGGSVAQYHHAHVHRRFTWLPAEDKRTCPTRI